MKLSWTCFWFYSMKYKCGLHSAEVSYERVLDFCWLVVFNEFICCIRCLRIGLGLKPEDAPQFHDWNALRRKFTEIFATKTQAEWCNIFDNVDACVTPVLSTDEAVSYHHNTYRKSFEAIDASGTTQAPVAAPRLSETPAESSNISPDAGEQSVRVLTEYAGYSLEDCQRLIDTGVVEQGKMAKL